MIGPRSGYPSRCCDAISGSYSGGLGASALSGRTSTNSGGFSMSVVMSWIGGTERAIDCCWAGMA